MRIARMEASRHKHGRVLLFMEDGACIKVTEQEVLDFGLRAGVDLDGAMLEKLIGSANRSHIRAQAAEIVDRQPISKQTLLRKLTEKGVSQEDAEDAAAWLESFGAIDDAAYASLVVRAYGQRGGPAYVKRKLYERGVPRDLWDDALAELSDPAEQIDRFLESKLRGRLPDAKERKKLSDALYRKGHTWDDIRAAWQRLLP